LSGALRLDLPPERLATVERLTRAMIDDEELPRSSAALPVCQRSARAGQGLDSALVTAHA
jgi:hypothetical protein